MRIVTMLKTGLVLSIIVSIFVGIKFGVLLSGVFFVIASIIVLVRIKRIIVLSRTSYGVQGS